MKILFTTNKREAISTTINLSNLNLLNKIDGVDFVAYKNDYENYDVIMMMGYDFDIGAVREKNPKAVIGIVDIRPSKKNQVVVGADFILANGIEMQDYCYRYCDNIYRYYIYPKVKPLQKEHKKKDKIIICYHGNKIHLEAMAPRISNAIEKLAESFDVELNAIYNIENLGKASWEARNFKLKHIQWSESAYEEYLFNADIGIVPNLIPIKNELKIKRKASGFVKKFNEDETDYLLRFKATSNSGRIFPFMQYGIPVVSDMFPSATQLIEDGKDGFIAYGTDSWYCKLKMLAQSADLRKKLGDMSRNKFMENYTPESLNKNLVIFLEEIINNAKNK